MLELSALAGLVVVQSPMVLVLVVGLVLVVVRRRYRSGRPFSLAIAGIGMLLIGTLMESVWQLAIPSLITDRHLSASQFGPISIGVGTLLGVWHAGGIGLLLGAAVSRGRAAAAASTPLAPPQASAPPAGFAPAGFGTNSTVPGGAGGGFPGGAAPVSVPPGSGIPGGVAPGSGIPGSVPPGAAPGSVPPGGGGPGGVPPAPGDWPGPR